MNKIEIQLICVSETFSKGETDLSFGESLKSTTPNVSNCQDPFKGGGLYLQHPGSQSRSDQKMLYKNTPLFLPDLKQGGGVFLSGIPLIDFNLLSRRMIMMFILEDQKTTRNPQKKANQTFQAFWSSNWKQENKTKRHTNLRQGTLLGIHLIVSSIPKRSPLNI